MIVYTKKEFKFPSDCAHNPSIEYGELEFCQKEYLEMSSRDLSEFTPEYATAFLRVLKLRLDGFFFFFCDRSLSAMLYIKCS